MYIVIIFICVCYVALVLIFKFGWDRMSLYNPKVSFDEGVAQSLSIVIVCKNEEKSLPILLSCLIKQSYRNFELVLVNDHSTDTTLAIMEKATALFSDVKLIDAKGFGKKNALKEGINVANGSLIITTDADCLPGCDWVNVTCSFQQEYPSDLIISPVQMLENKSILSRIQALEFITLVAAGAGAAGAGMPVLCNGANLAFTKEAWLQSKNDLVEEQISGDDIFLLQSIKKRDGVIRFLKSNSAIVFTEPTTSLAAFFKQRRRWASKSTAYTDLPLIFTACIVFGISLAIVILASFSIFNLKFLLPLSIIVSLKLLVDIIFLRSVKSFFQIRHLFIDSLLLSILYSFYIISVAFSVLISKPKNWS